MERTRIIRFFLPVGWLAVIAVALSLSATGSSGRKPAAVQGLRLLYRVQGKKVEFTKFSESGLLISRECQSADGRLACDAYDAFQRASHFTLSGSGSASEQAQHLCQMTEGSVVEGKDEHGNHARFCRYEDRSLIDLSSLFGTASR